ncbi:MAG: hypothetical protein V1779_17715 [bacterium]
MDFRLKDGEKIRTIKAEKASATVIEDGDLVALDSSGLIIKATATDIALAYAPNGAGDGETEIEVTIGNDFTLKGAGDAVFAEAYRGINCDLVVASTVQKIDVGENTTEVFKISSGVDAGVVGSASNIEVRINYPLF